ncbi:MAG: ABC transporter permease [Thermaerobacter sp.]|nr:ABC transporter permease [Thermaerobacter sp.]
MKNLSGGQRQGLALALVNDLRVLFLNEPTRGLVPQGRRSPWDTIRQLRGEGSPVALTAHYMGEAQEPCDQVAIMDHGRIMAMETPERLVATAGIDHGAVFRRHTQAVTLGIRDRAHTPAARAVVQGLQRIPAFRIQRMAGATAKAAVQRQRVAALVELPRHFGSGRGNHAVQVLYSEGNAPQASAGVETLRQMGMAAALERVHLASAFRVERRVVTAPRLTYVDFLVGGIIAMTIMQAGLFGVGIGIVQLRERGILRRLRATPLSPAAFLASRFLLYLTVALAQAGILLGIAAVFYHVHFAGSLPLFLAVCLLGAAVFVTVGLALSGLSRTVEVANSLSSVLNFLTDVPVRHLLAGEPHAAILPLRRPGLTPDLFRRRPAGRDDPGGGIGKDSYAFGDPPGLGADRSSGSGENLPLGVRCLPASRGRPPAPAHPGGGRGSRSADDCCPACRSVRRSQPTTTILNSGYGYVTLGSEVKSDMQLNLYIPKRRRGLIAKLEELVRETGASKNELVLEALEQFLRGHERPAVDIPERFRMGEMRGDLDRRSIYGEILDAHRHRH